MDRFGPFDLGEELGRGSFGVVHAAVHRETGRRVAVKRLLSASEDAKRSLRFEREAEIARSLDHPGVASVEGAGRERGVPWIAYEFVPGARTLDQVFAAVDLEERVRLVRDVAEAIGFAHARGVVHRDLKAANVLVDGSGAVRVTDFGLGAMRGVERLTLTGEMVGTPIAMAPEQVGGQRDRIGPASDVWALGVLLYTALTGAEPFRAPSFIELARVIRDHDPVPPQRVNPDVSPELAAVCSRCLEKEPARRFPDGAAVVAALDALRERAAAPRLRAPLAVGLVALSVGGAALVSAVAATSPARPVQPGATPQEAASAPSAAPSPTAPPATAPSSLSPEQRQSLEAAERLLNRVTKLSTRSPEAHRLAKEAAELAPFYGRALYLHGVCLMVQKRLDAGMVALEQADAVLLPYTDRALYEKRGALYAVRKRWSDAADDLGRAYSPGGDVRVAKVYGLALRMLKRWKEAAAVLEPLWRDHRPRDWRVPYHLAAVHRKLERPDAEIYPLDLAAARLAGPKNLFTQLRLALTSIQVGRVAAAEKILDPIYRADPPQAAALVRFTAGRVREAQGRFEEARRAYLSAARRGGGWGRAAEQRLRKLPR